MRKSNATYLAVALLILIAFVLIVRLWASGRAAAVVGPTQIRLGENGIIYLLSDRKLYLHDKDGDLVDIIPIAKFGISGLVIGDFWVYKNGDILLRRQVDRALTVSGEAEMFARTGAGVNDRLGTGESILQRCSTTTFACETFGKGRDVFDRITTYRLAVDEEKGLTYLSDTIGHELLMLDDHGIVAAKSGASFQFPNQILLEEGGLLYVADTNNHRIAAVKTNRNAFGALEREFKIVHPRIPGKMTWPMAIAHTPDRKWWVINADDNMGDGIVMIHNEKGSFEKIVSLPPNADPLCLAVVGDRILLTDRTLMRVYQADLNGQLLDDFGSLLLKLDLSELRRKQRLYDSLAQISMWLLLVLLVSSFFVARQARLEQATQPQRQPDQRLAAGALSSGALLNKQYDYHSILGLHRIQFVVLTIMLLTAFAFFIMISRGMTVVHKQFMPLVLVAHVGSSLATYYKLKHSSVELTEQGITCNGWKKKITSPWMAVKKINVYGRNVKITTDYGNFSIGMVEPADSPARGWLDLLKPERAKFLKQLVNEIQKRAPGAKVTISLLVRRQWNRL